RASAAFATHHIRRSAPHITEKPQDCFRHVIGRRRLAVGTMATLREHNDPRGGPVGADTRIGIYAKGGAQRLQFPGLGPRIAGAMDHEHRDLKLRPPSIVEVLAWQPLVDDAE